MNSPKNPEIILKKGVNPILIEEELRSSFLDYAMSVVVSRAIPDVRDGLKPVHRRILYTMHTLGFIHSKPYHKSVRVVGEVLGKFHPHGDQAVYGTMVGLVQEFAKRYPLLDGQGNWGSVDGDNAAAMRYTEVRMQKITQEMLADLGKETVDFVPTFDESNVEPTLLPARFPQLLINGTSGIAVGMATSIPPHNLTEVVQGCLSLLANPNLPDRELFDIILAPDFPTGGIICGRAGIIRAYETGRGNLILRAVVAEEETKKGTSLVITELPYQVNKSELIIKIADLVKNKMIEGISNIRDESDKRGMRLVIELKRGEIPSVTLNQLYKYTQLQTSVSFLMLALLDNKPIVFTLKRQLQEFLTHRRQVIYKRTEYDLKKALAREHILAGIIIALDNIDEVIAIIKSSPSAQVAMDALNTKFLLSAEQSKAILEMRLQRLTGLEQDRIREDIKELKNAIAALQLILHDPLVLDKEIKRELEEIKESYGDARRTRIEGPIDALSDLDLIPEEDIVVTLTKKGYIKRVLLHTYELQHRGGKGKMGMASLGDSDDIVQDIFVTTTHGDLLFFTNFGRVYCMKAYEIPEGSRIAKGRAIVNLLPLIEGEFVVKLLNSFDLHDKFIVMLTRNGVIKRTKGASFVKIRCTGIRATALREGDELVFCSISTGQDTIVIATKSGQGIRFKEEEVRCMGRQAAGVRGIRLKEADEVVGMEVVAEDQDLLFATSRGFGKRTRVQDFRIAHRGGVGVRTIPTGKRNGDVVGIVRVNEETQILLIDKDGKIIRISPTEVRTMGRQAQGVRLIRLDEKQELSSIVAFQDFDTEEELLAKLALAKEQQAATIAMMAKTCPVTDNDDEDSDVDMDEIQDETELDNLVGDFDDEQEDTEE
ncbi:DNA gyrase subunit A [Candidatus Chromulinivorax destructor]|uniref:DNA gyrase subunit A n=1 Tax=Candidatus Chromulinivorax destructor TaxID=2066483 RepID=A0A345ZAJ4_9BACT|nr:DNA gyrase subunit A [Candidatus Chromulinivorax destructor]AXK60311.1 DNA gyrase subunit A [Candidatus Chromulinivorax destructor]